MDKILDYLKHDGKYFQKYGNKEEPHLQRYFTFKAAISLFLQNGLNNIVETGCQRNPIDWGAGNSSLIFSETLAEFPDRGFLHSVDISKQSLTACFEATKHTNKVKLYLADSIEFLKSYNEEVGLLYLDSMDYEIYQQKESQVHQLKEIEAIWPKISKETVILLDDNHFEGGGKTKLTKEFLFDNGWTNVLDHQQSLFIKL
jgi:hypothetical protein